MKKEQGIKMVDQICDYILKEHFSKNEVGIAEALSVLTGVVDTIIRSFCDVIGEDAEHMIDVYCNALQTAKEGNLIYTTGDKEKDVFLSKIVSEMKAGTNIEEIVDKYVDCEDQETRQHVIEGLKKYRNSPSFDKIKIGY